MMTTMKKNIYWLMAAAASLLMSACDKPENPKPDKDPDPVFPTVVEKSIPSSSSATIEFSANLDWELSMPKADLRWFYLDDNGMKEFKVKGQKGKVSVKIHSESLSDNYEPHTTELSLKMGDQTKVIARVTLTPAERSVEVYAAKQDSNGNFVVAGTGDYEYQESKAESLMLQWPKGITSYSLPIKVRSSFEWAMKGDYPEWLEPTKTSSEGEETVLVLKGNPTKYPLDQEEGMITFTDIRNNDVVMQIPVVIPGCKDLVYTSLDSRNVAFNILGECEQSGSMMPSYQISITSTTDTRIIAVDRKDGMLSYNPDSWLKIAVSYPDGQPDDRVIQDRIVNLSASQNYNPGREALLLAIPGYKLEGLDISKDIISGGALRPAFENCVIAEVSQDGINPDSGWSAIVPVNSEFKMAIQGAGIHRTASSEAHYAELSSKFGTNEIYTLEYNNWFSSENALLASTKSFDNVKFYLPDGSDEDYDGYVSVSYSESSKDIFTLAVEYFDEGHEVAAVLTDAGKTVAVIIVRMTETYWPDVKFTDVRFVAYDMVGEDGDPDGNILPQNVLLERVSSGEIYDQYKSYDIPVWRLVYYSRNSEKNAMIYVPPFPTGTDESIERHPNPSWMTVECALSEKGLPYVHVTMNDKLPETGNVGHIVLRGGGRPLFVLICEREFMNN